MLADLTLDVIISAQPPALESDGFGPPLDIIFLPYSKLDDFTQWREKNRGPQRSSVNSLNQPELVIWLDSDETVAESHVPDVHDIICVPCSRIELEIRIRNYRSLREAKTTNADQARRLTWHRERMVQEHNIVQNMFANAFSRHLVDDDHVETFLRPLSNFNGDLFLLARGGSGSLYFMLGDFTGHGLAAAIGTIPASQTFFAMAKRSAPVSQMAQEINRQLYQLLPSDMFCCALILEMSATGDRINWWSGGIPPAVMVAPDSHEVSYLEPQHVPLGVLGPAEFDSGIISMRVPHRTRILAFTDGLIELGIHEGKPLQIEQLVSAGQKNDWDMSRMTEWIEDKLAETAPQDDLSVVMLTCSPTGFHEQKGKDNLTKLPFALKVTVGPNEARTLDPIAAILRGLSQFDGMERFRPRLYTVLSEAYNNALEHGV